MCLTKKYMLLVLLTRKRENSITYLLIALSEVSEEVNVEAQG